MSESTIGHKEKHDRAMERQISDHQLQRAREEKVWKDRRERVEGVMAVIRVKALESQPQTQRCCIPLKGVSNFNKMKQKLSSKINFSNNK